MKEFSLFRDCSPNLILLGLKARVRSMSPHRISTAHRRAACRWTQPPYHHQDKRRLSPKRRHQKLPQPCCCTTELGRKQACAQLSVSLLHQQAPWTGCGAAQHSQENRWPALGRAPSDSIPRWQRPCLSGLLLSPEEILQGLALARYSVNTR